MAPVIPGNTGKYKAKLPCLIKMCCCAQPVAEVGEQESYQEALQLLRECNVYN